jgi:hypothetical protein
VDYWNRHIPIESSVFSWRVICLAALLLFAMGAESVTLASEDYTNAHLVAGVAILASIGLAWLWWALLGVIVRTIFVALAAAAAVSMLIGTISLAV